MSAPTKPATRFRFGEFQVDLRTGELFTAERKSTLSDKPLQLLAALLERPGEMVTREELKGRLWRSDTFVDFDLSLNKAMNRLRETLQDSAGQPRYIETLPRRGYRFIGPVEGIGGSDESEQSTSALSSRKKPETKFILTVSVCLAVGVALVLTLTLGGSRVKPQALPTLKIKQLTTNSNDAPVRTGAISPDGGHLAFSDLNGLHVKNIKTGEVRTLPMPDEFRERRVDWQVMTWSPDGMRFLANVAPFEEVCLHCERFSAWVIPATGGIPRKLRADANVESVSPDGSKIAFTADLGTPGGHEIWLTDSQGDLPRKLYRSDENDWFHFVKWSPDGRRLTYLRSDDSNEVLESRDLEGGSPVTIVSSSDPNGIHDYVWSSDGRIIYGLEEASTDRRSCNYWEVRVDARTAKPTAKPSRLTNWAGFALDWTSISADGKRLAFVESANHSVINTVSLDPNGTLGAFSRKLTLSESWNWLFGWTADSRTIVFGSNRDGSWGIYKQSLQDDTPVPIATGLRDLPVNSTVTPDGKSVLYVATERGEIAPAVNRQLLRLPIAGGHAEPVPTGGDVLGVRCARYPATQCVMAASGTDHKELVFSSLDAVNGRGVELMRINLATTPENWEWQLSPDGNSIALFEPADGIVRLLKLNGHESEEIHLRDWRTLYNLRWAADGKSFLISNPTAMGAALFLVDSRGTTRKLWEQKGGLAMMGIPSPDGRHLAIMSWSVASNLWMLEDF